MCIAVEKVCSVRNVTNCDCLIGLVCTKRL